MADPSASPTDPFVRSVRYVAAGLLLGVLFWTAGHLLPRANAVGGIGDKPPLENKCSDIVPPEPMAADAEYIPS